MIATSRRSASAPPLVAGLAGLLMTPLSGVLAPETTTPPLLARISATDTGCPTEGEDLLDPLAAARAVLTPCNRDLPLRPPAAGKVRTATVGVRMADSARSPLGSWWIETRLVDGQGDAALVGQATTEGYGLGVGVRGRSASGRLRSRLSVGRASIAANEPLGVSENRSGGEAARVPASVELAYDLARDRTTWAEHGIDVSVTGLRARRDPRQKGLLGTGAADPSAALLGNDRVVSVVGDRPRAEFLPASRSGSVIEEIASMNLSLSLFPWIEATEAGPSWTAKIDYGFESVRSLLRGAPGSGTASRTPLRVTHSFGAHWSQKWLTVAYRTSLAEEHDDSFALRAPAFGRISPGHSLNARVQAHSTLALNVGIGRSHLRGAPGRPSIEGDSLNLGVDWRLLPGWSLAGTYGLGESGRSDGGRSGSYALGAELAREIFLAGPSHLELPGRLFARPSTQASMQRPGALDLATRDQTWRVEAGVALTF